MREREREEARDKLRAMFRGRRSLDSLTVYTVLKHVSKSGMARWLDLYIIRDNRPVWITWLAARSIGAPFDKKREALRIDGAGMDMGFAAVYDLSIALFCMGNYKHEAAYRLNHRWL